MTTTNSNGRPSETDVKEQVAEHISEAIFEMREGDVLTVKRVIRRRRTDPLFLVAMTRLGFPEEAS